MMWEVALNHGLVSLASQYAHFFASQVKCKRANLLRYVMQTMALDSLDTVSRCIVRPIIVVAKGDRGARDCVACQSIA